MAFTHLHIHSHYSINRGLGTIKSIVSRVKELGQKAVALTDYGPLYGTIEFFKTCISNGIKPIIGAEIYTVNCSMTEKKPDEEFCHMILLCENNIGYKNLIKIIEVGHNEGLYYRPRVDYDTLTKYSDGLICITSFLTGEVSKELLNNNYDGAKENANKLMNIFGKNNLFLEIQNHGLSEEMKIHSDLIKLSKEIGVPLVASNNCHYVNKEDSFAFDCILCNEVGKKISDSNRIKYEDEKYYITSEDEMNKLFDFCPEAVSNTKTITDRCNVSFEFVEPVYIDLQQRIDKLKEDGISQNDIEKFKSMIKKCDYRLPKYDVPSGFTNDKYLTKLAKEGVEKKYDLSNDSIKEKVNKRLEKELSVIDKMGYVDYFLIVADYVRFAKENGIPVGPGRGPSAGSLVCYALGITDIDPIKYNLYFERFINIERNIIPDIDIDFSVDGRDKVVNYVKGKYGVDNVAQITSLCTWNTKTAIWNIGRVLNIPFEKINEISNLLPKNYMLNYIRANINNVIHNDIDCFNDDDKKNVLELRKMYARDNDVKIVIDNSIKLERVIRAASVHASGIVIIPNEISNCVPLIHRGDGLVSSYDIKSIDDLGFIKFDFLGLKHLDVVKECLKAIKDSSGVSLNLNNISYDDENIYEMLSNGDTKGIFQFSGEGMIDFLKKLKPNRFEDLIMAISVYRPGPIEFIDDLVKNKEHPDTIEKIHPIYDEILSDTYGMIIYQEQIMNILNKLSGMSLARAEIARRIIAKKKIYDLKQERQNFIFGNDELNIIGCIKNGISEDLANTIFDKMIEFAPYTFNKSHATAYAKLAYQMAYLKYYYDDTYIIQ